MYPASPPLPAPEEPRARRASGLLGALFALALAYGAGGWLVLLHYAEGGHEHHEPNLLVHWLRDGSLALPGTLLAVWLALRVADRYLGSARRSSGIWAASLAAIAGVAGSAVLAFGTPVHEWLFHADEGHELPLALHVGRDFILALAAAFPLCGAVAASMLRVQGSARLPLASGVGAWAQLLRVAVAGATLLRRRPTRLAFVGIALLAFTGASGGTSKLYRYYIPNSPAVEGAHYLHPGPGMRFAVNHGLYGVLVAEPPGSTYLDVKTAQPTTSGWEAMIAPAANKSFREFVKIYGEIGNEGEQVFDKAGQPLPQKDALTGSYRPGTRVLNYRSDPFFRRLQANKNEETGAVGSYAFGDPPTPM